MDRMGNERIRGTAKVIYIPKQVQECMLKWYWNICIGKRRRMRRQESDGDGDAGEKKEMKTEAEVVG